MNRTPVCEPLENRNFFAVSAGLDPNYLVSFDDIQGRLGGAARVYQATPAASGRTYLLATRRESIDLGGGRTKHVSYLAFVAIGADGDLDRSFADNGIALTGREVTRAALSDVPGIMKIDGRGRLYYVDNQRVLRFRPNGTTDVTFGKRGAATFATADRPVQVMDVATVEDGALVATYSVKDGVQHFAVQKVNQAAPVVWETEHDTGEDYDETGEYRSIDANIGQFAQSGGNIILAHIEADNARYENTHQDFEPGDYTIAAKRQDVVVTRFDASGRGAQVARRELRRTGEYDNYGSPVPAIFGASDGSDTRPVTGNVAVSRNGQTVLVQTDRELLKLNVKKNTIKRLDLPGPFQSLAPRTNIAPTYQLLPGGGIGVVIGDYLKPDAQQEVTRIYKYLPDGTLDASFGDKGQYIAKRGAFATGKSGYVDQIFLDSEGRLNFMATGRYIGLPADLTIRRIG